VLKNIEILQRTIKNQIYFQVSTSDKSGFKRVAREAEDLPLCCSSLHSLHSFPSKEPQQIYILQAAPKSIQELRSYKERKTLIPPSISQDDEDL
jgi:hypothetical protein